MQTARARMRARRTLLALGVLGLLTVGTQVLVEPLAVAAPVVTTPTSPTADAAVGNDAPGDQPAPTPMPEAPTGAVAAAGDRSATVRWTSPADTSSVLGYVVTTSPGGATTSAPASAASAVVPGLTNGTAYTFTVTAQGAGGSSAPSAPTASVTPYGAPNPPSGLTLSTGDGTISAAWTPAVPNGQPVSAYRVDLTSSAGNASVTVPGDARTATVGGLTNGAVYAVAVTTIDATASEASGPSVSATPGRAPTAPGAVTVTAGTALVNGAQNVVVSWSPSWADGTPVTGYVVSSSAGGGTGALPASATRATLPIAVGRATVFTVTALSSSGSSAASAPAFTLDAIDGYYATLGGPTSYLGVPVAGEAPVGTGRVRQYAGGSIYWGPYTGSHAVHGWILVRYLQLGGPTGLVGFPTSDESASGAGRRSTFTGANLYWSPPTGTHEVQGLIRDAYIALGEGSSVFGLPTTDELPTPDRIGRFNHFLYDGSIYWTPATGAHEVHGAIRDRWSAGGWETGMLGYPVGNEYAVVGGRRSDFQFGSITWTPSGGARQVVMRGDRIVAVARTHLGQRYVWGGAGPTTFDCSGLVQYVHRQLGMSIPRTTWLQAPAARPIPQSAAMPGDVIFLLDGSHEGIYVGGGQMIDAPHTGAVVVQRAIWTSSYSVGRFW